MNILDSLTPQEAVALQSLMFHGAMTAVMMGALEYGIAQDMAETYAGAYSISHSGDPGLYMALEYTLAREGMTGELERLLAGGVC